MVALVASVTLAGTLAPPAPTGVLVDLGGQHLHIACLGSGTPAVLFENGLGDVSVIWALVQPRVAQLTTACAYDRGGYAWSDPGTEPRSFAQLNLELATAAARAGLRPPYILVGQSYGGAVVRRFAEDRSAEVGGLVLVDAAHEDQSVFYDGASHLLREGARGRMVPAPRLALDADMRRSAASRAEAPVEIGRPLDRLPPAAQRVWTWALARPLLRLARDAEADWSPEEFVRFRAERLRDRATLGDLPLRVLSRGTDSPEHREQQRDLGRLSRNSTVVFAPTAGHNIHVEDPGLVVQAIAELVELARHLH
jgi:pimeloyl-ACP methyl ester carboxylesterase